MTPGTRKNSRPIASSTATPASILPAFWPLRSGYMMVPHDAVWDINAATHSSLNGFERLFDIGASLLPRSYQAAFKFSANLAGARG